MAEDLTFLCIAVFVILFGSVSSDQSQRRPLDQYVHHYEHIQYDKDNLIYHHNRVRRSISGDRSIKLIFNAFHRKFNLKLYPDDQFIHKDARFYNSNGELSGSKIRSYFYRGHDTTNPSIQATGNLAFGVFDGTIRDGNEVYYIEPSNRYMDNSVAETHSIMYRHSDIDTSRVFKAHPHAKTCTASSSMHQQKSLTETMGVSSKHRLTKRQDEDSNPNLVRCSLSVIADYKFFQGVTDRDSSTDVREAQAAATVRNIIGIGSTNFERQDFNSDDKPDGIHFSIFNLTVETTPPPSGSFFVNEFIGPEAFLTEHSSADWSDFCLSYRFTYRDFDLGVLGLAYVAAAGSRGGICDDLSLFSAGPKTLNTGIVTLLNFNTRVSTAVSGLTFTHEAGHNFGSKHDPDTDECQPTSSNGGQYIMFNRANDGSLANNNNFSPCSRRMMSPLIESRGQANLGGCFTAADNNCGNNIVDIGEDCDCGVNYDRVTNLCDEDPCCNGSSCKAAVDVECSPSQGDCCYDNCTLAAEGTFCRLESDCSLSQNCNGTVPFCPRSEPRQPINGSVSVCNNGENYCVDGECTGSICIPLGLADCECSAKDIQCHVCCIVADGTCQSTIVIAETNTTARNLLPSGTGKVLAVGFPCNNFNGYCDFYNRCKLIDTEGSLRRLTSDILDNETFQTVLNFLQSYWWAPIVAFIVILIILFLVVLGCDFLLPRPKHMVKRYERRKNIRHNRIHANRGQYAFNYDTDVQLRNFS